MIRVDHAGEYGAVQIYRGQRAVFDRIEGARACRARDRRNGGGREPNT